MPNWCYTNFTFHGNKTEIEDFHGKIKEWTSTVLEKSDFGEAWLGNIVSGAGLKDRIDSETNRIRCRGSLVFLGDIELYSEDTATFTLDTETAWAPMGAMWSAVIEKLDYKTVGFSYMAEECGCEVYEIYDPYGDYDDLYYVDVFIDGEDLENDDLKKFDNVRYYASDEDLLEALQHLLKTDETNIQDLIQKAEEYPFKSEDTYIRVHKYYYADEPY